MITAAIEESSASQENTYHTPATQNNENPRTNAVIFDLWKLLSTQFRTALQCDHESELRQKSGHVEIRIHRLRVLQTIEFVLSWKIVLLGPLKRTFNQNFEAKDATKLVHAKSYFQLGRGAECESLIGGIIWQNTIDPVKMKPTI